MVTADLHGGLGNQMFQIAAAYSIAKDNNDEAVFNFNNHVLSFQGNPALNYQDNKIIQID